jgi:hypothetical protein
MFIIISGIGTYDYETFMFTKLDVIGIKAFIYDMKFGK